MAKKFPLILFLVFLVDAIIPLLFSENFCRNYIFLYFYEFVDYLVPAVGRLSAETSTPYLSSLILSFSWCFFPVYLVFLLMIANPFGNEVGNNLRKSIQKRRQSGTQFSYILMILFLICFCVFVLLSDFRVFSSLSFVTGEIFSGTGMIILSMQRHSIFGLILEAWASPLLEAFLIYMFFLAINAAKIFFINSED